VNAPRMSGFGAAAISMAALGLLKPATSIPATPDLRHQSRKLRRDALHRLGRRRQQYLFDRNYPGVHDDIDGFIRATDRGLEYLQQFVVPANVLNEDTDGTDEVFVRARFVDGDCGSRIQDTNVVKGDF